jgi:hypothetical protein
MNDQTKAAILSAVRSLLIVVGTWATAKGWLGAGVGEQLATAVIPVLAAAWGVHNGLNA